MSGTEPQTAGGQVLWHTMLSLDGFIAGPGGDMGPFFSVDAGPGQTVDEVVRSTGALLVGRRTQDVEDRLQPGFYGGAFRGPFFVLRHDPPAHPPVVKGVTGQFLDTGIEEAVALAKKAADGANVVVLGANVARQCLERLGFWTGSSSTSLRSSSATASACSSAPVALRSGSRRCPPARRARPRCCATPCGRRQRNDGEASQPRTSNATRLRPPGDRPATPREA